MCFSPQRRAIFDFSSDHMTPHPPLLTSLLFDSPDTRIIGKTQRFATSLTFGAGESSFFWLSRYCIFFLLTLLHLLTLLSCDFTSSLCFSSAFQLSILSEVYYLNFLRLVHSAAQVDLCSTFRSRCMMLHVAFHAVLRRQALAALRLEEHQRATNSAHRWREEVCSWAHTEVQRWWCVDLKQEANESGRILGD